MDVGSLKLNPVGLCIAAGVGILLLVLAWKMGKSAVRLVFILLILAALAAAVIFFMRGGF
jgi:hypothetical protein